MNIFFTYDRAKDIWCIANKGKASNNSPKPTKIYELLEAKHGSNPTEETIGGFINSYLQENNISTLESINQYEAEWREVADEYHQRAEAIFEIKLPEEITVYLTINNRCPYNIAENLFYASFPSESVRLTIMHELWHFYTWYGLGVDQEEKLGKETYNDLKEALTVLLNEECADLMPEGIRDNGYPQHSELRTEIQKLWTEKRDISWVWNKISEQI